MRLRRFRIEGLFGLFDHIIEFRETDRITIIHAPNGYGKTIILKLISAFFSDSTKIFRDLEYTRAVYDFDDGSSVTFEQTMVKQKTLLDSAPQKAFTVTLENGQTKKVWNPLRDKEPSDSRSLPMSYVERFLPQLKRVSHDAWRDMETSVTLNYYEILENYWEHLPPSARRIGPAPDWLSAIRNAQSCQLIETQRLMVRKSEQRAAPDDAAMIPAVQTYSRMLAAAISKSLAESGSISQSLDSTFPNRLLARMRSSMNSLSEVEIRSRLTELEKKRARLAKADLLDEADGSALIPDDEFDDVTKKLLTEYVNDAEAKLAAYDDILPRIELFTSLLNDRLNFKVIRADKDSGFVIEDILGRPLNASSLSSGEQHELVLFYDLIFKTKPDTLLLIDEPEISLHIAWQKKFLDDLRRIIAVSPMDVVLATHSPQLIAGNVELTVQLKGPKNGTRRV